MAKDISASFISNAGMTDNNTLNYSRYCNWPNYTQTNFIYGPQLRTNIFDDGDSYRITIDVPGVKSSAIKAEVNGKLLTVTVDFKAEEHSSPIATERPSSSQQRLFILPDTVEANKCDAKLDLGVLCLTFPKAPEGKTHKIEIR
jgi:HSP20 family protein